MFKQMTEARINDLHYEYDEETGLKSIIAIAKHARHVTLASSLIADQPAEATLFDNDSQPLSA